MMQNLFAVLRNPDYDRWNLFTPDSLLILHSPGQKIV
jgi:hypothetical protein